MSSSNDLIILLRNSPKTLGKIKEQVKKNLIQFGDVLQKQSLKDDIFKEVDIEIPNINELIDSYITDENVINTVVFSHRTLYDLFDKNNKILEVSLSGTNFTYKIYSKDADVIEENNSLYTDRISCEIDGFMKIIELTEKE